MRALNTDMLIMLYLLIALNTIYERETSLYSIHILRIYVYMYIYIYIYILI